MIKQVLLAAKVDPDDPDLAIKQLKGLQYPVMLSPKIDGIRCHIDHGSYSRKNKLIPNQFVQQYLKRDELNLLDGELVVGSPFSKSCFNTTQSGVMSRAGEPNFRYYVFDEVDPSGSVPFEKRFEKLQTLFGPVCHLSNRIQRVIMVPQRYAYSVDQVLQYELRMVAKGWEGIMVRSTGGIYKQGRSTLREQILIKVKRFVDGEALVLGAYEQETNLNPAIINEVGRSKRSSHRGNMVLNGHLGGFYVQDLISGIEFDVGTMEGFTQQQRKDMWDQFRESPRKYLNRIIRYKHFPVGAKNKPRHPIMTGFRNLIDIGEADENA